MFLRGIFICTVLLFSIGSKAQVIQLYPDQSNGAVLTFYPPDPLASLTGTSAIICSFGGADRSDSTLIAALTKKGGSAFRLTKPGAITEADVIKAFQYLQGNAGAFHIMKAGILALNTNISLSADLPSLAFIGLIDPVSLAKIRLSASVPLFLDGTAGNEIQSFYNSWSKKGCKAELHLHQQNVNDSVKTSEIINWMASLGFLKPLSTEKTEAQKKRDDLAHMTKYYDNLFHKDWAWLSRFEAENLKMPMPGPGEKRVVFLGNSITEGWIKNDPDFFKNHNYINRGIGGQTTPQMLVRIREDVVNLHPQVVVILAGINDIAENTGPSKIENVAGNIFSMAEIAKANNVKVILCSVLPALSFPWHPGINPVDSILKLNSMLKEYAEKNSLGYVDYYSAVVDENRGFKKDLAKDGVHPNLAGYKIMEPLVTSAIERVIR